MIDHFSLVIRCKNVSVYGNNFAVRLRYETMHATLQDAKGLLDAFVLRTKCRQEACHSHEFPLPVPLPPFQDGYQWKGRYHSDTVDGCSKVNTQRFDLFASHIKEENGVGTGTCARPYIGIIFSAMRVEK